MTTPYVKSVMKSVIATGFDPTEMMWFDISNAGMIETVNLSKLTTHRPPFEKSLVLWSGSTKSNPHYEMSMLVAGTDPEEGIVIDMTKGIPTNPITFPPMVYLIDGAQIRYGPVDEKASLPQDVAELMLSMVAKWFDELDTGCESYKPEVKQTFTNRRKIAQGKLPTYDWHTVVIEPSTARQESKGGTHSSPRLHDRRGHLRRLRSGKNVWVKSCKVGNASIGVVFKDYKLKEKS